MKTPLVSAHRVTDIRSYPNAYSLEIVDSFNPLLLKHFGSVYFNLNGDGIFHCADYFNTDLTWWLTARAFIRASASWRRMLVSQPAPSAPSALGYGWQEYGNVMVTISKGHIVECPHQLTLPLCSMYPSLYFRAVWGRLKGSTTSGSHKKFCRDLLHETSDIIHFQHGRDVDHHEPTDVQA
ncbi:uncharacterized protein BDW43DRAFT_304579 [Aspergillus alliaceus]|uniref:uncharacterized protein n=1 Tax=Petromyces alliaceus TaxID=209559 RepID=UPI0012A4B209|nr:uncharacterized protein BDW43DRAFT_304579 [Aspergillus alliaceus]KAB8227476.1 hypothetical protein BDW43DRAFT_304579 [Aspergillus alliaceus]